MTKTQSKVPARTLGYELATEARALTELSSDEVDQITGARMDPPWTQGCDGRCTAQGQ